MRAAAALREADELWATTGLTSLMRDLVHEVWTTNRDRHEPDELGDSARTLGFLCYENLSTRLERRIVGSPLESVRWNINGLQVARPRGSLQVQLGRHQFYVMKAPMNAAVHPDWDSLVSWEDETLTRTAIAKRNSVALGGFVSPADGQPELFSYRLPWHSVDSFLFVWGGEILSGLTAGWLTVPVLGASPFAAVTRLWLDENPHSPKGAKPHVPSGPSFDQRTSAEPALRLKQGRVDGSAKP